ncbi:MAG TPA: 50S ribosomal protein L29 [Elusimicrobia bacterium]|nr:MAG: 50S ribosomal protein L29 [Elusimicrobia bacterium GWF2_62_30]HBA61792.1 50S ribosomal protein L29 [Elusimicrobiota bacterium]
MKSKDKENIKNLSDAELRVQASDLKKQIFQLNFKRITSPIENPVQLRTARRKIALINTIVRQRELAKEKTAAEVKK